MAGLEGFEPPTPGFGDRCSSQAELQAFVLVPGRREPPVCCVARSPRSSKYLPIRLRSRLPRALQPDGSRRPQHFCCAPLRLDHTLGGLIASAIPQLSAALFLPTASRLPGFLVRSVFAAERAELLELHPVGVEAL